MRAQVNYQIYKENGGLNNMNKKILIVTAIVIIALIAGIAVKNSKGSTVQVQCKTAEGECTYLQKEEGKVVHQQNFDFKDVMQCNIETLYKTGTNDVIEGYKLYLALNNGNDWYDIQAVDQYFLNYKLFRSRNMQGRACIFRLRRGVARLHLPLDLNPEVSDSFRNSFQALRHICRGNNLRFS